MKVHYRSVNKAIDFGLSENNAKKETCNILLFTYVKIMKKTITYLILIFI